MFLEVLKSFHNCKMNVIIYYFAIKFKNNELQEKKYTFEHNLDNVYHLIRADIVLMAEECNFHKTESKAITSSVIIVALSFSEVTDKVQRAN